MRSMPFSRSAGSSRCGLIGLCLCLSLFLGCAGGDPEPPPAAAPEPPAAPQPAAAPAAQQPPAPPEYQEAVSLHSKAEAAAKSVLVELQAVQSGQDFETRLPSIKKYLDEMLTNIEQADAKISTLDTQRKEELNRLFVTQSAIPATFQQIGQEITRVTQTQGVAPMVLADFVSYMLQFQQRMTQVFAKSQAAGAGEGAAAATGNPDQ